MNSTKKIVIVFFSLASMAIFITLSLNNYLHAFLHTELQVIDTNHILMGSTTAVMTALLLFSLMMHNRRLYGQAEQNKMAIEDIVKNNTIFRLISDNSNDMIHFNNMEGRILYVNPVTSTLLGYRKDEIINKPAENFIYPPDRQQIADDMQAVAQGKSLPARKVRLVRKNTSTLDVEVRGFLIETPSRQKYIGAVIRDVSDRKRNDMLIQAQKEWEQTFNTMTEFVSVHDKDFKVTKVNEALCEFLGKRPEEIVGKFCYQVFHNDDRPVANCPHAKSMQVGHAVTMEVNDQHLGVPLHITCSPYFDESDNFKGSVHIARSSFERYMGHGTHPLPHHFTSICASCKNIRIENDDWVHLEDYFRKKYGEQFTHCICRKCQKKLYPEFSGE